MSPNTGGWATGTPWELPHLPAGLGDEHPSDGLGEARDALQQRPGRQKMCHHPSIRAQVARLIAEIRPDTIVTFGPDGGSSAGRMRS